jgi:predicted acyl esterase
MVTIETISIVFTGLSISLAAFYYISILRNAQKTQQLQLETRQAELYMKLWEKWNTKEFSEMRFDAWNMKHKGHDDFWEQYNPVNGSHP